MHAQTIVRAAPWRSPRLVVANARWLAGVESHWVLRCLTGRLAFKTAHMAAS